jgi:hypothetical protein
MNAPRAAILLVCFASASFTARPASAHMTPPIVLATDRDAVGRLLSGASRYFVREVRLSPAQRDAVRQKTGWVPDADYYRFYVGRGGDGAMVASVLFLSEFTIHGPVRVAVALGPDGRIKGASVVEVTEETYTWVKPLVDSGFLRRFSGRDARMVLGTATSDVGGSMPRFYADVIARLIARAAALYEVSASKG